MIEIFQEMPDLPPKITYTGEAVLPCKDILDTVCLDIKQVKAIILATSSPSNSLL